MRIAVLGAGAIGCFFGGLLARSNEEVTFVARKQTLAQLKAHDLVVKSILGDFHLSVSVLDSENLQKNVHFDAILLAVKSTALEAVLPVLKQLTDSKTKIICLLNGIGNEERLTEVFHSEQIIGGSAFISIIREAPGVVNHVGENRLVLGEWGKGRPSELLRKLVADLQGSGIHTELTADIRQTKWEKLLWNITYNPLTALTGTRVGEALADPDLKKLMETVIQEYLHTAAAAGVIIRSQFIDSLLVPDEKVRRHKTSMLQDLENGGEMETEAILGFVLRVADQYGVEAQTIRTFYHLLHHLQRNSRRKTVK